MGWTTCWKCKERFGLSADTEALLRRSGQTFHCPWGHAAHFKEGPTEAELLRKERDTLKQQLARKDDQIAERRREAETAWRTASAYKGVATRVKNRVSKGVCPCCNRTFANLQRHMAGQHPGFTAEEVTPAGATVQ